MQGQYTPNTRFFRKRGGYICIMWRFCKNVKKPNTAETGNQKRLSPFWQESLDITNLINCAVTYAQSIKRQICLPVKYEAWVALIFLTRYAY